MSTVQGKLLDQAAATGDGKVFDNIVPMKLVSLQLELFNSPSRVALTVLGIVGDSATFGTLLSIDTNEGDASGDIFTLSFPTIVRQLKANVGTISGAGAAVSLHFAGAVEG